MTEEEQEEIKQIIGRPIKYYEASEVDFWASNYEVDDVIEGIELGKQWARENDIASIYHIKFFTKFIHRYIYGYSSTNKVGSDREGFKAKQQENNGSAWSSNPENRRRKAVQLGVITSGITRAMEVNTISN